MRRVDRRDVFALACVFVAGAACCWWAWGRLGDPINDYGRDAYTAWQMLQGRRLYRDLAYQYAPLAPVLTMLWFKLLSVSLRTLIICNLVVLAGIVVCQYWMLRRTWGAFAAGCASVVFVVLFGFGNFTGISNYNFLTPYANAAVYGYATSLATAAFVCRSFEDRARLWLALAGVAAGLSALVKLEFLVAAWVTLATGLVIMMRVPPAPLRRRIGNLVVCAGAFAGAIVVSLCLMSLHVPMGDLLGGLRRGYQLGSDARIWQMQFFRSAIGIDFAGRSVIKLVVYFCIYMQALLPAALVGLLMGKGGRYRAVAAIGLMLGGFWLVSRYDFTAASPKFWLDFWRGVPVLLMIWLVGSVLVFLRARPDSAGARAAAVNIVLIVFAMVMLLRMILNVRAYQFGFVQAAPAVILICAILTGPVPAMIDRAGGCGAILRWTAIGLIGGIAVVHLRFEARVLGTRTVALGSGADAMLASGDVGPVVREALAEVEEGGGPADTMAVLPEGPLLNFLSRRRNPTPYELVNPVGLILSGGEESVLRSLEAHPPDWVLIVRQDTTAFGASPFGMEYGRSIWDWVKSHYRLRRVIGGDPMYGRVFGIGVYHRDR